MIESVAHTHNAELIWNELALIRGKRQYSDTIKFEFCKINSMFLNLINFKKSYIFTRIERH